MLRQSMQTHQNQSNIDKFQYFQAKIKLFQHTQTIDIGLSDFHKLTIYDSFENTPP